MMMSVQALQRSNIAAGGQYLEFNKEQYLIEVLVYIKILMI